MNKVRELRKKKGLTQQALANLVGTSQQTIQRIETGAQDARFDIAFALCVELEETFDKVFPETKKAFRDAKKRKVNPHEILQDRQFLKDMAGSGVEVTQATYHAMIYLRGGNFMRIQIPENEHERLKECLKTDRQMMPMCVFDSVTHRHALNMQHVVAAQFLMEPENALLLRGGKQVKEENTVDLEILAPSFDKPIRVEMAPDRYDYDTEDLEFIDGYQLQEMFRFAEDYSEEVSELTDADGETVMIQWNGVSIVSCPLALCEPKLFLNEDLDEPEDDDEPEDEAGDKETK